MTWCLLDGEVRERLGGLPGGSVHCVVTSPPYWGLRDYGLPPSVWGGVETCDHDWDDEQVARKTTYDGKTRWQHVHNGRGEHQQSRADRASWIRSHVPRGSSCRRCGAWLGCLGLEPNPEMYVHHVVDVMREVRRVLRRDGTCWLNLGDSYSTRTRVRPSSHQPGLNAIVDDDWSATAARGATRMSDRRIDASIKDKDLLGMPWRVALALQADVELARRRIIADCPLHNHAAEATA